MAEFTHLVSGRAGIWTQTLPAQRQSFQPEWYAAFYCISCGCFSSMTSSRIDFTTPFYWRENWWKRQPGRKLSWHWVASVGVEEGPKDGKAKVQLEKGFGEDFLQKALLKLGFEGYVRVCQMSNFGWRTLSVQRCTCMKVQGEFRWLVLSRAKMICVEKLKKWDRSWTQSAFVQSEWACVLSWAW